jgi:hypothetical protein
LILLFDFIIIDRVINCRIIDTIADSNKRFELNIKNYEIIILITVIFNGDSVDSAGIDFEIDVIRILIIFIFIRSVDICEIN